MKESGHVERGGRVALAGLEHERVSAGDGDGKHPGGDHAGEVEGRDARYDAQRLAHGPVVQAGRDLVGEVALQELWNTAGKLDDLDTAGDFTLCIGEDLAVLAGDDPGDGIAV